MPLFHHVAVVRFAAWARLGASVCVPRAHHASGAAAVSVRRLNVSTAAWGAGDNAVRVATCADVNADGATDN